MALAHHQFMTVEDIRRAHDSIKELILQKNYPCVAAIKSVHEKDYEVGFYRDFGSSRDSQELRSDLEMFLKNQIESGSPFLSYWAIFEAEVPQSSEEEFERKLWRELSALTSIEKKEKDWAQHSDNPNLESFAFCLFGEQFFVVGLHPQSSRFARRFSRPALVFNVFRQFEALKEKGQYDSMVRTNRMRDKKFQGSENPMALKHAEVFESIQFSGKENPEGWKCPFQFLHKFVKS